MSAAIGSVVVDINPASAMPVRSVSIESIRTGSLRMTIATFIGPVHVIQRVPVRAPNVAIVAAHIPALEIDVFSQPARKHEFSSMLGVVVIRHQWTEFDLVCIRRLRKYAE